MTKFPDLFAALAAPFEANEVKTRQAPGGRSLSYITARTAMNRLDSVLGPECWWDDFAPLENSVICKLSIRLPDGTTITKVDAGGYAGMADSGDDDKSGFSDAFKRAAAKFGVARYLYRDGVPQFEGGAPIPSMVPAVPVMGLGSNGHAIPGTGGPNPKLVPASTLPPPKPREAQPQQSTPGDGQPRKDFGTPKTGKALFAWTKDMEQQRDVGLLKYLNNWAKLQEFPARMVDWDADQVALAYAEACRKLGIEQSPAKAAEPPKGPGVEEVRNDLIAAIWDLARKQHGGEAADGHFWQVVSELDNLVGPENVLSDFLACQSVPKLNPYLDAVRTWRELIGGAS